MRLDNSLEQWRRMMIAKANETRVEQSAHAEERRGGGIEPAGCQLHRSAVARRLALPASARARQSRPSLFAGLRWSLPTGCLIIGIEPCECVKGRRGGEFDPARGRNVGMSGSLTRCGAKTFQRGCISGRPGRGLKTPAKRGFCLARASASVRSRRAETVFPAFREISSGVLA
jgi:hypothetical protein